MNNRTNYEVFVQDRTYLRYIKGLIHRWYQNIIFDIRRKKARRNGATVGDCVVMTKDVANHLNQNFQIGSHCILHDVHFSSNLHRVTIGNNVIIGSETKIIRGTHNIDSLEWENVAKHENLIIEDYVWLCPNSVILPSVKKIGYGAVVGANAVVVKDVEPMTVVSGNPAKVIKNRSCVHENLVVESLLGGDYLAYKQTWKNKKS